MTTATATPREILEDRWECATHVRVIGDEWSELMNRLDKIAIDLYEAVARQEWTGDLSATAACPGLDGSGDVHSAVLDAVRLTLLEEIEKAEAALRAFPTPLAVAS